MLIHQKSLIKTTVVMLLFICIFYQAQAMNSEIQASSFTKKTNFFPICAWMQNSALAGKYKEMGINCYVGLWKGPTAKQISDLRKHKMKVICSMNSYAEKVLLKEPLILAWMHDDEPDNAHKVSGYWNNNQQKIWKAWPEYKGIKFNNYGPPIAPTSIIEDYRRMKRIDSSRPVFINLGQGVAWRGWPGRGVRKGKNADYMEYAKGGDIVAFDIYPVSHTNPEVKGNIRFLSEGINNLQQLTQFKKPIWNCIETNRVNNPKANVTPAHVKAEVWLSIISGSKGIIYFFHEFKPAFSAAAIFKQPEMIKAITAINKQLSKLAGIIKSPEIAGVVINSPQRTTLKFSTRKHNDYIYLFTVNTGSEKIKCQFSVKDCKDSQATLVETGETLMVREGNFSCPFQPLEVKIFKITMNE